MNNKKKKKKKQRRRNWDLLDPYSFRSKNLKALQISCLEKQTRKKDFIFQLVNSTFVRLIAKDERKVIPLRV